MPRSDFPWVSPVGTRQRQGHRELCQAYAVWRLAVDEDFTSPSVSQFIVGGFKWPERTNASQ